ncbi:MAG: 3-deoxy-manno-octulosonate cytidylyltransferase [Deltaproteobacteria bacterium]|nr:3-deoxy-manno-octulosonate cytidylyltransferase [Deltaproteobacteria bacterium]
MAIVCPRCGKQYDVVLFDFRSHLRCECGYKITKDDLHRLHTQRPQVFVIIPARFNSRRLPGKPLIEIKGKPMIQHVYESASRSSLPKDIIVATDDRRILECVKGFGGKAIMTKEGHPSGTDRLAEAASILNLGQEDIVVNVQGDMPYFEEEIIEEVASPLIRNSSLPMSTLAKEIEDPCEVIDQNCVKVVITKTGRALYFSRAPIPYDRDRTSPIYYKHIGIYAYRKGFLDKYIRLPQTPLEVAEGLEQLRALEHGYPIQVVITRHKAIDINVPDDLKRIGAI